MTAEQDLANYGRIPAWQPISGSGPLIKFQIFKDNRAEKTLKLNIYGRLILNIVTDHNNILRIFLFSHEVFSQ